MTEITPGTALANGYVDLGSCIIGTRELENLYAYLEEGEGEREQELARVAHKAAKLEDGQSRLYAYYRRMQEQLEARNQDLDRLARLLEKM